LYHAPVPKRVKCSWTFRESEVEGREYQDDSYVHRQPFPELILEQQEIYSDDDGYQEQYVKRDCRLASHFSPRSKSLYSNRGNSPYLRPWSVFSAAARRWEREQAPSVLGTALDAAVVAVADPVEPRRTRDRQRSQYDGVDEREDGRGAADL
jgi:hypothetical protein